MATLKSRRPTAVAGLSPFPAFDYERCLEQGLGALLFALRRETVLAAAQAGVSTLYRLFTWPLDRRPDPTRTVVHLPDALGAVPPIDVGQATPVLLKATADHLATRGTKADVTAGSGALFPAVRVRRRAT